MSDSEEPRRRAFEVIEGHWIESTKWLDFPATLRARSPVDRGAFCRVRVSRADATKAAEARRRQPAFDFWSVLCGKAPPVPLFEKEPDRDLMLLSEAHACFRGIKRPVSEDGDGGRYLAYILKPRSFYVYDLAPPAVICRKEDVPSDLVFVAYVRLDEPAGDGVIGMLTHWQFVEADGTGRLPVDFDTRYQERLW